MVMEQLKIQIECYRERYKKKKNTRTNLGNLGDYNNHEVKWVKVVQII
jgi:hypothetical protein